MGTAELCHSHITDCHDVRVGAIGYNSGFIRDLFGHIDEKFRVTIVKSCLCKDDSLKSIL